MAAAPLYGGSAGDSAEDYSAAATVVRFDPPLPLLRAPVPSDASTPGEPPVLAFRDAASWRAAWDAAEASLVSQCKVIIPPPDYPVPPAPRSRRVEARRALDSWTRANQCGWECSRAVGQDGNRFFSV